MTAAPPWRSSSTTTSLRANGSPAYIPVQTRRNLTTPTASTVATTSQPAEASPKNTPTSAKGTRTKIDWPESVRQYVQRSFVPEYQVPEVSREEMEAKLREVITKAAEGSGLNDVDWDNLPLPQQMILEERKKLAMELSQKKLQDVPAFPATHDVKSDFPQKRKSTEFSSGQDEAGRSTPPWRRTANPRNGYEDRASYPHLVDKRRRIGDMDDSKTVSKLKHTLETRRQRFENPNPPYQQSGLGESDEIGKASPDSGPIIGTCQQLEKNYFRLTAPPRPENVRPLEVLRKTLDLLKRKWRSEGNYGYICDQFKSLRQDLTVQHIKNEFTVSVYEIHARIALEKGDLGEYNQCQTQLRALYAMQLGGHPTEFKAYRILYFIYTRNQTAINDALADLTPAEKVDEAVKHALDVRSALALGNYHRFFQLYLDTPNMGAYLMDMFVDRERLAALACICKSYKPDVSLRFITEELGFENEQEAAQFIVNHAPADLLQEQDGEVKLLAGKAGMVFEQAKAEANRIIDIKGQI
ncbi:hypothetical protein VTO42DRAFT_4822 [Malbranchea cinnamomea]